jgi:hypothetical protein
MRVLARFRRKGDGTFSVRRVDTNGTGSFMM